LPVLGSIATTDASTSPGSDEMPSYAACWASASRVSWTVPPWLDSLLIRSTSLVTNSRGSSPASTWFWVCSIPVWL
jgi:hypothetical protein